MDDLIIYRKPDRPRQGKYFGAVAQADDCAQMSVIRWILSDCQYQSVAIMHDKDEGKKPHVHLLMKTKMRMQANTLAKRFGNYLHFECLVDPYEYARYLTHETFAAQGKHIYVRSEIIGNMDFYNNMICDDAECLAFCELWSALLSECENSMQDALQLAISRGYVDLVKSVMSHGYFYEKYFKVKRDTIARTIYDSNGDLISSEYTEYV